MAASYHEDWRDIVMKFVILAAAILLSWAPPVAAQGDTFDLEEWPVEWGGRTRDPAVAPDGKVWFVGQAGNYVASLDPATGAQKRYEIEEGTNPHTSSSISTASRGTRVTGTAASAGSIRPPARSRRS